MFRGNRERDMNGEIFHTNGEIREAVKQKKTKEERESLSFNTFLL